MALIIFIRKLVGVVSVISVELKTFRISWGGALALTAERFG